MADVGVLNLQIKSNAGSAATSLGNLADALSRVKSAVGRGAMANNIGNVATALERLKQATSGSMNGRALSTITRSIANATKQLDTGAVNRLKTAADAIERYVNSYKSMAGVGTSGKTHLGKIPLNLGQFGENGATPGLQNVESQVQEAVQSSGVNAAAKEAVQSAVSQVQSEVQSATAAVGTAADAATNVAQASQSIDQVKSSLQSAAQEATRLQKALEQVKSAGKGISKIWKEYKDGISNMHMPLSGLISSFGRIAKYRMLRAIIKGITEGIKEGTENVYMYSQAVGTSFAPAMDSAASSIAQFKNSIGAAAAPLLQAIIPVLNQIVSAAITAVNWINQLFALLGGASSWTRALPQATKAFNETKKAAGGAGGAVKEMLAAFDELNVIASESGGGGGGASGALEDYATMFEEVSEFNETLKDIADFVNKNAEKLKETALEIGGIVALWKVSKAFSGVIGQLATLAAAGLVMDVTWKMTAMFDEQYIDTGNEGWLIADAVTNAVGATLAGKLVSQVLGTGAGLITAGITLVVSGAISYGIATANDGTDNARNLARVGAAKAALGALLTGAGFYVSTGSMVAALFGALMAAPMFFAVATFEADLYSAKSAQTMAAEVFGRAGAGGISVEALYKALQDEFDAVSEPYRLSLEVFESRESVLGDLTSAASTIQRLNSLFTSGAVLTQEQADQYKQAWETVFSAYDKLKETEWETIWNGFNAAFNAQDKELEEQAIKARAHARAVAEGIDEIEAQMIEEINAIADKIMQGIEVSTEDYNRYLNYIDHFGVNAKTSLNSLNELLKEADTIDFETISGSVDAATQFIHNVMDNYKTTIEEIDSGLQAQLDAINIQKQKVQDLMDNGLIDQQTYDTWMANLEEVGQVFKDAAEKNKQKLADDIKEAFRKILNTAKQGLNELLTEDGKLDWMKAYDYVTNTVTPIIQAMKESGSDYHDIIKETFSFGEDLIDALDIDSASKEEMIRFIVGQLSEIIQEAGGSVDLSTLPSLIFDPLNWDIEANQHDMAMTLIDYLGFDTALASLKDTYNLNLSDIVNIVGYDTFTGAEKDQFLNALRSVYGNEAVDNLVADYAKKTAEEYTAAMTAKLEGERVSKLQDELRKKYPNEFKYLFNTLKSWDFTMPMIDTYGFDKSVELIKDTITFTGEYAQEILENWDLVAPGIDDKNPQKSMIDLNKFIRTSGINIDTIIKNWKFVAPAVSGISVETSMVAIERIVQTTGVDVNTILSNWNLISPHIDEKNIDASVKSITDTINSNRDNWVTVLGKNLTAPDIALPNAWGKGVTDAATTIANAAQNTLANINPQIDIKTTVDVDVNANVTLTTETASSNVKVRSAIAKPAQINAKVGKYDMFNAEGAYGIPRGDVFIANEAGAELIGSINGKTSVANQGQIIEGIAAGVAASNEEQNVLLREQNALLRQILQKDSSVRLGASSALGRTVKKSLDMYSMATGEA